MNRDTPAGKASVKHLCEVFGVSRQACHKALRTPAITPELPVIGHPYVGKAAGSLLKRPRTPSGHWQRPTRAGACARSGRA